jgi:hypothetical protein
MYRYENGNIAQASYLNGGDKAEFTKGNQGAASVFTR